MNKIGEYLINKMIVLNYNFCKKNLYYTIIIISSVG